MDAEIKDYLLTLIEEDADHSHDHLAWLASPEAVEEEDRELQISQCERTIELAGKAAARLTPHPQAISAGPGGDPLAFSLRSDPLGTPPHSAQERVSQGPAARGPRSRDRASWAISPAASLPRFSVFDPIPK